MSVREGSGVKTDRPGNRQKGKETEIENVQNKVQSVAKSPNFKSPSDTTIYSPGLRHINNEEVSLMEKISNFVESIRLDTRKQPRQSPAAANGARRRDNTDNQEPDWVVDQLLVQAEKFKAKIEAPKGNDFQSMLMPYDYEKLRSKFVKPEGLAPIDNKILFLRNFDQDDEFFHITSQINPGLRTKIENSPVRAEVV